MSDSVTQWLEQLGLGQYSEAFEANAVELGQLTDLDHQVLQSIGVNAAGHRMKILKSAASLGEGAIDEVEAPASGGYAERRQLTVMFCDLVGSTELSQRLDPEDLREVNRAYQDACKAAIEQYDGYVARYMGDGVLAYFGYPRAHEDDADRAIHAGLNIVDSVTALEVPESENFDLRVRVGIATGSVVVGDLIGEGASQESAVVGETPNLAARLQGLAGENAVVIAPGTYKLVSEKYEYDDLGLHDLKGIDEPVHAWQVIALVSAESRFEAKQRAGLTPFVGREHEIRLLLDHWDQAKEGNGQVVLLSGEAGIGKSRIVERLRECIAGDDRVEVRYQCSPYHVNSALHPVKEQLERAAGFSHEDSSSARLEKLKSLLSRTDAFDVTLPLIASLLSISLEERYAALEMTADQQKQATLEALAAHVERQGHKQPVLLAFEDAHWADPTSIELLSLIVTKVKSCPALLVITFRSGFSSSWVGPPHVTALTVNRLSRGLATSMVERITGKKRLPDEVRNQILLKTDGVPLFVEELTKTVTESGFVEDRGEYYALTGPLPTLGIPNTLQDSLMARLDRLVTAKAVAQYAAVIGRQFSFKLLAAVSRLDEAMLQHELGRLVGAELLYQRGQSPQATYVFKHSLVQDTAYNSLLKSTRRTYHQRIAYVLAEQFAETANTQPELLAYHYTEAGCHEEAVCYWQRAGQRAREGSAHAEAIAHLTRGIEILATLPQTPERNQQSLSLHVSLGNSLAVTKGWAAPEVEDVYARARELCQRTGETLELLPVLWGSSQVYILRADVWKHREISKSLLSLAQSQQDPVSAIAAHWVMGVNLFHAGDCAASREQIDQANALRDPKEHRAQMALFGIDLGVFALSYMAHNLWCLGYPEQALHKSQEALALARKLSHPFSQTVALAYAALLSQFRRQLQVAREHAKATAALCEAHGFAYYSAWGKIVQGWIEIESDEVEDGMGGMQQGLAALQATGSRLRLPYYRVLLATAFGKTGHVVKGLRMLDEALNDVQQTGERWSESELYRLKGELLLQKPSDNSAEAETCIQKALDIAGSQQAKSWELRAATSLARLWQSQGRRQEALGVLAPIFDWFTEGFDIPDLKEAKSLLDNMSQ